MTPKRSVKRLAIPALLLTGLLLVSIGLGSGFLSPERVFAALFQDGSRLDTVIVWTLRLPRIILAILAGHGAGAGRRLVAARHP